MKDYIKSLATEKLHENIVSQHQILELLHNGQFPGAAYKHLDNGITYLNFIYDQYVEEFAKREDAKDKFPEAFKPAEQGQPNA